jgi:hypothetical protein
MLMALLASGIVAGCGTGYSGTKANQVAQWASQYSVVSNDQLVVDDASAVKASVRAGKLKDVTSNCAGLAVDAGTAYGNLPTPDATLTDELNTAYEDFAGAGGQCAAAASLGSGKISAALVTIAAGLVSLKRATRLLAAEGVH